MNSAQYTRVKELFAKAVELPPGKRTAYLDREAAGDEELRRDVEALLRHHDEPTSTVPSSALERSAAASSHAHGRSASHLPLHPRKPDPLPQKIGQYRIVREIGRGGMGMVYLGVREEGRFQKRVAIKVIKKGMDSEDVLRRFELERQLLSALNHPNIARLFEGGTTDDGRPYFALEYVEGLHLDHYADRNKLTVDERLNLFKQVCSAVAYAHRNLVVHRDIKPANIIVTEDGTVKLMDFGIAKLLNPELSLIAGDPTAKEMRVMTPEYASPEQVRGEQITTASDVYSLGVLLYELLTGHRPYRIKERLRAEIERVICEQEPERPSTAISKIEEVPDRSGASSGASRASGVGGLTTRTVTPQSVSATRGVRPEVLRRRLAGDIDNIIMMAMRKEPQRRYTSVERFSEDIDRHMNGHPVTARPASFVYRSSKFVRRNKAGVAIAALIAISAASLAGVAFTAQAAAASRALAGEEAALREAQDARASEAELRRQQLEAAARASEERALRRAMYIREMARIFTQDFNHAIAQLEGATSARELLVTTALSFLQAIETDQDVANDPALRLELAAAYYHVGGVQAGLRNPSRGDLANALKSYQTALELRQGVAEGDPEYLKDRQFCLDLMHTWDRIGDVHRRSGLPAHEAYQRQFDIASELYAEEPDNLQLRLAMATAVENSAVSFVHQGRHADALAAYLSAHEHYDAIREQRPDNLNLIRNVAVLELRLASRYHTECRFDEAMEWAGRSLARREHLAGLEPYNARFRRDAAVVRRFVGRYTLDMGDIDAARPYFIESRDDFNRLATTNPDDIRVQVDRAAAYEELGLWHWYAGDAEAALENFTRFNTHALAFAEWDAADAIAASAVSRSHERLGAMLALRGENADAIRRYRNALEITSRLHDANPDDVGYQEDLARQHAGLAQPLIGTRMLGEASRSLERSRAIYEQLLDQVAANCHHRKALARVLAQQARLAALQGNADACLERAERGLEVAADLPADVAAPLLHAKSLGLRLRGDHSGAEAALNAALALLDAKSRLGVEERELRDTIRAELER